MNILQQRCLDRWYHLKDHKTQLALVDDDVRFKVVPSGRRSGKTERAKRFIAKQAMYYPDEMYFLAAPTRDQVKKIFWKDIKLLTYSSLFPKKPSESELIIYMPNGSEIHLIGLDKPERMEGQMWTGGVVDEIANVKAGAWEENISPALDTYNPLKPDHRAWCWLIGVPEGMNHYYDLAEYARHSKDPDWKLYTWFSSDILPDKVIQAAKRRMSAKQFRQEYEASFETASGRIYEDYSDKNKTTDKIKPHEQLLWHHDFNYTPLSSGIAVMRDDTIHILDEIILKSAIARNTALEFVDRYKDHENRTVFIYGDPSGRAGEKHGQRSNYVEIETVLKDHKFEPVRKVKNRAPAIRDRQNAVRAFIMNAAGEVRLKVNPVKAPYADKGLATATLKEGSTFQEEDGEFQHITTAIGYMIEYEHPVARKTGISEI